jgi:hypothetical protein
MSKYFHVPIYSHLSLSPSLLLWSRIAMESSINFIASHYTEILYFLFYYRPINFIRNSNQTNLRINLHFDRFAAPFARLLIKTNNYRHRISEKSILLMTKTPKKRCQIMQIF